MDSRYLVILLMLVFPGLITYGQFVLPANPKQASVNPDLIIQVGAFHKESNSLVLKEKLSAVLDKPVILVVEDGYYKIQITGFSSQEEMEELYPTLAFIGLKNFWVLPVRKREEIEMQTVAQSDSAENPVNENIALPVVTEDLPVESQPSIVLQVDVYHDKTQALNAKKRITDKLDLPVEIVQEWEYYKVFVTGFQTTDEANECYSTLAKLGFPKITLIKNYKKK